MRRGRITRAFVALALALGLSGMVVAVEATPAAAASCAFDYADTSKYGYADWRTGEPVWKDTRWISAYATGCHDVNVRNPYDRWNNRYSCAIVRIWWRNESGPRNWVWVCQGYAVLSRKVNGSSFQIETLNRPFAINVMK